MASADERAAEGEELVREVTVRLVDFMGDDVRVAEAARVSFGRAAGAGAAAQEVEVGGERRKRRLAGEADARLIRYLGAHAHWTPSAHVQATFYVAAPVYVARQLMRHTVGLVPNEVSRRYVDAPPQFFAPRAWRRRSETKKQGSHPTATVDLDAATREAVDAALAAARRGYAALLAAGVAPEQARGLLPMATMTAWYWTGSLAAFARVCDLRLAEDAQAETRAVAAQIDAHMRRLFPAAWAAARGEPGPAAAASSE